MDKKLLVLSMSGGLDSATTAVQALEEGYIIQPIVFNYGQKNFIELVAQEKLQEFLEKRYPEKLLKRITISLDSFIKDIVIQYQNLRDSGEILKKTGEEFYTPNRNLLFMVIAATIGEIIALSNDFDQISVGLGIHKHSSENYKKDYWDITPQFANRLRKVLELNDSIKVDLYTPFVDSFKNEIIQRAIDLKLPLYLTWSCYNPKIEEGIYTPCKVCEACKERETQAKSIGVYDINNYSIQIKK